MVKLRLRLAVRPVHLIELVDSRLIHRCRVGQDGSQHIMLCKLIVLRHLDAAQQVRDAGDAEPGQLLNQLFIQSELLLQVLLSLRRVEESQQALGVLVVDIDDHVGIADIVDPRHMLVPDSLNAVAAESVFQKGRALKRLADRKLCLRVELLQPVSR